ncbi:hypothetical protein FO033_00220 [Campylobacter jejuni]|nr:hypothetical protein [Campylobacter jejuni]
MRNEMKKYFKIFTNKTNAKFDLSVCSVVLSSSVCFAAVQATSNFYISEHSFKDNQVYDSQAEIFKKLMEKISMLLSQNTLYQI